MVVDETVKVHRWVNFESMLKKCLVGRLKTSATGIKRPPPSVKSLPPPLPRAEGDGSLITTDWIQNPVTVTLVFYTRRKDLDSRHISWSCDGSSIHTRIYWTGRRCFDYQVHLERPVEPRGNLRISTMTGKLELVFRKTEPVQWTAIGIVNREISGVLRPLSQATLFYRTAVLSRKVHVTHNVRLFTFTFTPGNSFHVPIGWHVNLKLRIQGIVVFPNFQTYINVFPLEILIYFKDELFHRWK